jgi:hypothetical protein
VDDAFDTFRKQRVWAVHAKDSSFPDRYVCPLCQTEVVHASGPSMADHFRHRRGTDHDKCERYSKVFQRDVPLSQHEDEHIDAVLVATQSAFKDDPLVSFAVRFLPAYKAGFANFISGETSTPYQIHEECRQQYFHISVPEKQYHINAKLSGRNREIIEHHVDGFDDEPVVFRATDREAVRIPKHRILKPGAYIAVSREPIDNFHPSLAAQLIKTIAGLNAKVIQIPENPNWQVRQNVKSLLHFEIATKVADYGFLLPTVAYEMAPDCWEISKDSELKIFVRVSRNISTPYTHLLVQHRQSGRLTNEFLPRHDDADEFVIVSTPGEWRPDLIRVGLAHPVKFLFEINFVSDSDIVVPLCGKFSFEFSSKTKIKTHLAWSSHELPAALLNAASGFTSLVSITRPDSIAITLSDRRGQRITIPQKDPGDKIIPFLRQARFPCVLTASGYPDVTIYRGKPVIKHLNSSTTTLSMVPRSRRHARLLSAFNRGLVSSYSIHSTAL